MNPEYVRARFFDLIPNSSHFWEVQISLKTIPCIVSQLLYPVNDFIEERTGMISSDN